MQYIEQIEQFLEREKEIVGITPKGYKEAQYLLAMIKLKSQIISFTSWKTGLSTEDSCNFLYYLNGTFKWNLLKEKSRGVCSFATFAGMIFKQLSPKSFSKHFGFEKYILCGDTYIYNPLLLTDILIYFNQDNFIRKNGISYALNPKKYKEHYLATIRVTNLYAMNWYLSSVGLKIRELAAVNAVDEIYKNTNHNYGLTCEHFNKFIDMANEVGASIMMSLWAGVEIQYPNGDSVRIDGAHAVNCNGRDNIGYLIDTWNKQLKIAYDQIGYIFIRCIQNFCKGRDYGNAGCLRERKICNN